MYLLGLTYKVLFPNGLGNCIAYKSFVLQTLLWLLKFVIYQNLEHGTITISNLAWRWDISTEIRYSCGKVANSGTPNPPNLLYFIVCKKLAVETFLLLTAIFDLAKSWARHHWSFNFG